MTLVPPAGTAVSRFDALETAVLGGIIPVRRARRSRPTAGGLFLGFGVAFSFGGKGLPPSRNTLLPAHPALCRMTYPCGPRGGGAVKSENVASDWSGRKASCPEPNSCLRGARERSGRADITPRPFRPAPPAPDEHTALTQAYTARIRLLQGYSATREVRHARCDTRRTRPSRLTSLPIPPGRRSPVCLFFLVSLCLCVRFIPPGRRSPGFGGFFFIIHTSPFILFSFLLAWRWPLCQSWPGWLNEQKEEEKPCGSGL